MPISLKSINKEQAHITQYRISFHPWEVKEVQGMNPGIVKIDHIDMSQFTNTSLLSVFIKMSDGKSFMEGAYFSDNDFNDFFKKELGYFHLKENGHLEYIIRTEEGKSLIERKLDHIIERGTHQDALQAIALKMQL